MTLPIADLGRARILITNDDGIAAPGLRVLERVARQLSRDVWVVAPEVQQSAASHSLTIRRPLRLRQIGRRRFAVDGTPTDCVLMAANRVLADRPPDLVLSGINWGANLGEDVHYSGTVAAAKEATLLGLPAIAFSLAVGDKAPKWQTVTHFAPDIIRRLAAVEWPRDLLMSVNFPDLAPTQVSGVRIAPMGRRQVGLKLDSRTDPGGEPYYWVCDYSAAAARHRDSDLQAVLDGAVAVTPLTLDLTHRAGLKALQQAFG